MRMKNFFSPSRYKALIFVALILIYLLSIFVIGSCWDTSSLFCTIFNTPAWIYFYCSILPWHFLEKILQVFGLYSPPPSEVFFRFESIFKIVNLTVSLMVAYTIASLVVYLKVKIKNWFLASVTILLTVAGVFLGLYFLYSLVEEASPSPPSTIQTNITPSSETYCPQKVKSFLSEVPEAFENVEKGVGWCRECVENNGIPTLSLDSGPFCNSRTSDKGKLCTDSNQCEGICLSEGKESTAGDCSFTKEVVGCVFEMRGGQSLERCFD